jgi:DNA helicase-2/ATP-dependent DNA helicase PcrA
VPARFVPSPEQRAAIEHPATPLLIVAGAGTGKTSVMAERIIHFLTSGQYREDQILGLTFTNKAAAALKARIAERRPEGTDVTVATYHSFGASLVADHAVELDLHPRTRLLTRTQAWQLLFAVFDEFRFQRRGVLRPSLVVDDGLVLASRCADHLVGLERLIADCDEVARGARWKETAEAAAGRRELCQVVAAYERRKRQRHLIDYGDQIRLAVQLLVDHPDVAADLRARYPAALLDEYQDTNYAQRVLLQTIYPPGSPITAVGDDMQSIYAFRGAHRQNILNFTGHFPPVATTPLTVNRRSGPQLVALANRIQGQVTDALEKELRAPDDAPTTEIRCFLAADDAEEAATIAQQIQELGPPWRGFAVLCRKRRLIPTIVEAIEAASVPVTVVGSSGLLDRPEVVDVVAWLQVLAGAAPVALLRILRGPRYRIGWRDLAALTRADRLTADFPPTELDEIPDLSDDARQRLTAFLAERAELSVTAGRVPVLDLAEAIIRRTDLWVAAGDKGRENLLRFLDLTERFAPVEGDPGLAAFVEYLRLLDESEEDVPEATATGEDAVTVMTIHQAKGLEFPNVWVPGLTGAGASTIFPDPRPQNPMSRAAALPWWVWPEPAALPTWQTATSLNEVRDALRRLSMEEEWRLLYVACTRAERHLTLSAAHWYPGPASPPGPSLFYEFVAEQGDLVTQLFSHEPATVNPAVSAMERLRYRAAAGAAPAEATAPAARPAATPAADAIGPRGADGSGSPEPGRLFDPSVLGAPPPRVRPPVPTALSVTSLVAFHRCPRQFYWSVVRPLPRRPSPAARLGTEVHRLIELRAARQLRLLEPDASAEPGIDLDLDPEREELPDRRPGLSPADLPGALVASFAASPFGPLDPLRVEAPFVLAVAGRAVRGRVDAVYRRDGRIELVDFKTGREPAPGDGGAATQLELYALAAARTWREDPNSLRTTYCYLRAGEEAVLHSEDWDTARLETVEKRLAHSLAGLDTDPFEMVAGAWCRRCDFAELCPAGRPFLDP